MPAITTKPPSSKLPKNLLIGLAAFIVITPFFNYVLMTKSISTGGNVDELVAKNEQLEAQLRKLEAQLATQQTTPQAETHPQQQLSSGENDVSPSISSSSPLLIKANSINSYWWPSAQDGGGLLGKIYQAQNPTDCSSSKFFVWRSKKDNAHDTRGLTAWAHAASGHLLHALTDGDHFHKGYASRVLINDEKLWPMAKGCLDGPETRECYFEPLTNCKLSHVDEINTGNSTTLAENKNEYHRAVRTVYSSQKLWFRLLKNKYSWTSLPGNDRDHSAIAMIAANMAYYFRPKPWLRKEIGERIHKSIPADLNPERTVGVPLRRSDKCFGHNITGSALGELDCPPLSFYLDGVKKFIQFDPLIENVIVTSEDKAACDEFVELMKKELPSLRVVLNVGDVQQGTGSGSKLESYVEGSANANVVSSALTSLHLHLRARYFIITSKSTWTSTIAVMARVYGFATEVFVLDIGRNVNIFSHYARSGCGVPSTESDADQQQVRMLMRNSKNK
ncbi:hypothetical protein ACHAXR_009672 [Thalassiosira sp. AJA248-18]